MQDIFDVLRILDVYVCLTGCQPRRTNNNCYRGRATWRAGDGLNVSLDNERGIWHDFATDAGGGILDLIVQIKGGTRRDALIWAAEFAGIALKPEEFTSEQKSQWAEARRALERELPDALYWQRAAVNMAEEALVGMKSQLFDPIPPPPKDLSGPASPVFDGIYDIEKMLSRLRHLEGQRLIDEYHWWRERYPATTNAMIDAVKRLESSERAALHRYLHSKDSSHERSCG